MRSHQGPVFRRVIVPWFDSETACGIMIALLSPVFLFGLIGFSVVFEESHYLEHIWVPVLLMVMSGLVILTTSFRLIKRFTSRLDKPID